MAISEIDPEAHALQLRELFERPMYGNVTDLSGQEKNWGFFVVNETLLFLYSVLPCTRIFEYSPESPRHAIEHVAKCHKNPDKSVQSLTLLDVEGEVHNSCNPILWEREGDEPNEYLIMVHNRYGHMMPGYNHWLLRVNAETFQLTHISYGIVFGAALHHGEGHMPNIIIVGSMSLLTSHNRTHLLIFGGEGDKFAIHKRINLETIAWLDLREVNFQEVDAHEHPR